MDHALRNIAQPHHNDVLYGRGGGTIKHNGNMNWRKLVGRNKGIYGTLKKRQQKTALSLSIVFTVRSLSPPGRFLQKDEDTELWFDVGNEEAQKKTSQQLREQRVTPLIPAPLPLPPPPPPAPANYFHPGQARRPTDHSLLDTGDSDEWIDNYYGRIPTDVSCPEESDAYNLGSHSPQQGDGIAPVDEGLESGGLSIGTMVMSIDTSFGAMSLASCIGTSFGSALSLEPNGLSIGSMLISIGTSFGTISVASEDQPLKPVNNTPPVETTPQTVLYANSSLGRSSRSKTSSSRDTASTRAAKLGRFVDVNAWEGVVLAAASKSKGSLLLNCGDTDWDDNEESDFDGAQNIASYEKLKATVRAQSITGAADEAVQPPLCNIGGAI